MSEITQDVLYYLINNRIPTPFTVDKIKVDYSEDNISNAIIELSNLGYLKITRTVDQEYPVVVAINELD